MTQMKVAVDTPIKFWYSPSHWPMKTRETALETMGRTKTAVKHLTSKSARTNIRALKAGHQRKSRFSFRQQQLQQLLKQRQKLLLSQNVCLLRRIRQEASETVRNIKNNKNPTFDQNMNNYNHNVLSKNVDDNFNHTHFSAHTDWHAAQNNNKPICT